MQRPGAVRRVLPLAWLLLPSLAAAGPFVQGVVGASQSAAGALRVERAGAPAVTLDARWRNEPFVLPPYWVVRAGWAFSRVELALALVHHKVFLDNPVAPVQQLSISHGFNLLFASIAAPLDDGVLGRVGAGAVVAHPESTVAGQRWPEGPGFFDGYVLAGPAGEVGVERRWGLARWLAFSVELAFSAAWARVPVVDGHAQLVDLAAHLRLGLAVGWFPEGAVTPRARAGARDGPMSRLATSSGLPDLEAP